MEPGFAFLTSSRGCAPFTVNIQTLYLSSVPGTTYYVNWGDGTAEETYVQVNATGVNMVHTYPNYSVNCGYDVTIDASNACNPRGSVVPITTQVVVWTNDVVSISPTIYRVCAGYAANVLFTDNSTWNCFPRATRENNEPRWIQWIYGTGAPGIQIPNVQVNGITPGSFPYLDPAPNTNPKYPVLAPGQTSLVISVPVTVPADLGKEFEVTLRNWNQCNAYDNNVLDGNAFNPINGDLVNGDNPPQVTTARVVIVPSPQPDYITRLGNGAGPIQSVFCIGDNIYFDNQTPGIAGSSFQYTWEFYDNATGSGAPVHTSNNSKPTFSYTNPGQKLIRLSVKDQNAAGNCLAVVEHTISISPSLVAKIAVTDWSNNPTPTSFCQQSSAPFNDFQIRFSDASVGAVTPTSQWRWEFYDANNNLSRQEPVGGGFTSVPLGPFDLTFTTKGIYRTKLITRDNITSCQTEDEAVITILEKPVPLFSATEVCTGQLTTFNETSTLQPVNGESIALREWDFNYDGVTFNKDAAFDNKSSFTRSLGAANTYSVALRVTTNQNGCSAILVMPVKVNPLPVASFAPDIFSGCSELEVTFANTSIPLQPDIIDSYSWEVSDGGAAFQVVGVQHPIDPGFSSSFTHTFTNTTGSNKIFDVRLRVRTAAGCENVSAPQSITVFPGTKSGFISINYSPFNSNCSPQSIDFTVDNQTQSLNPSDYKWQLLDGSVMVSEVSTGTDPRFSYVFANSTSSLKDYSVKLITTLSSGCYGDSTRTIRISPVPVSAFEIDTLQFDCQILKVRLTAEQKGLSSYHWVTKENGVPTVDVTNSNDTFVQTFNRPLSSGVNNQVSFSLETKNFANCTSPTTNKLIEVLKQNSIQASFAATPVSQSLPGSTVTISNKTNPGPWTYAWDFGDGTFSSSANVANHTYATYGQYVITLRVSDGICEEIQTQKIEILAVPPQVDFTFAPPAGCIPLEVKFTNLSKFADPDKYVWEFGDKQASSAVINPTHTYYEPGKYTVSLSASNATGQIVSVIKEMIIEVYPRPVADFVTKPLVVTIPGGVLYTRNTSSNATRFVWDFGDGDTSTEVQPEHQFKQEGFYTVRLIAYNQFDCPDTTSVTNAVKVERGGQILIPNAFSPNTGATGGGGLSDGKNDVFLPLTRGVVEFELLIFNRWGELLFESKDSQRGWDGTFQGKLCQQDVYMYKLKATYENGEQVVRVGDINLIR